MNRIIATLLFVLLAIPCTALGQLAIAPAAERVGFDASLSQSVLAQNSHSDVYINVELTPDELLATQRVPMNIALVIDKSGSMASSDKIGFARDAAMSIIDQLESYDRVAIVTFDSDVQVVMESRLATHPETIKAAINRIRTGSNTALYGGMTTGAEQVRANYNAEFLNRVIVLSDGIANVGPSSNEELATAARTLGDQGISVTTMGLGLDYNENAMTAIADAAGGNYYFIESADQMAYQFGQEIYGMTRVAALHSTLTLELSDGVTLHDVYGYDFTRDGNRVTARIGDLIGGRTMTVTARIGVDASTAARMPLAAIGLAYTDAVDGRGVQMARGVVAELSADQAQQVASVDMTVGATVQKVRNAQAITEAMEAYSSGDDDRAQQIVMAAREETASFNMAAGAAADMDMEESLDDLMMEMDEAAAAPAARSSVSKARKAEAREDSRGQ